MGVREKSSQAKGFTTEDASYNDRKNRPPELRRASSTKRGARSKKQ